MVHQKSELSLLSKGNIIMNTVTDIENTEVKMQYILDENGELVEIPKDKCVPVEYPIKYKLKNAFEVFVRVDGTENYWISNYGRCVNNYKSKIKNPECNKFYEHKQGKCHYTIFEIERVEKKLRGGVIKTEENQYKRETTPEDLVVDTFLVKYKGRFKVWHKDGDESNNWYKNLLTVTPQDYKDLKASKVTWQELNLEQEYIEYENKASSHAYTVDNENICDCYNKSIMCQLWLDNPKAFAKWYLNHYYECDGEEMDVDKDLFGDGSGMYCPDFCCILPKGLNTLLANSKKHYDKGQTPNDVLPLGVRYNSKTNKYHGEITFTGAKRPIPLSEWNTPEEAFAEYKIMKQSDICRVVAEYKESIPDYIYDKFLKVEVKPY